MASNSIWWDIKRTISYNCLFNFIIGNRGAGKTYGALKNCIEDYLKTRNSDYPKQFLYVRRNKTELEKLTIARGGRLFQAVQREFKDHTLKAESNVLYCDGEVMGYAQPLSTASILKSDSFPYVATIIFDEFIIDNTGTYHYLKDEVRKFLDLYETVARMRDVRVFFLSNAVSVANPYFDYFHLDKPFNGDIQKFGATKDILVQNVAGAALISMKKETRFGKLIDGSEYGDYAIDNKWLLDNTDFIEQKTQRSIYYLTLRYKDTDLGIWFDPVQWLYYVSLNVDKQCEKYYSVTTDDHKPNVMLLKSARKLNFMKSLLDAYQSGAVRYESIKLKSWFRDIMRMCQNA